MPTIRTRSFDGTRSLLNARTSGRDLRAVRRPQPTVDVTALKKAELVAHAESLGVDASGTKSDILGRLTPESNDATVETDG